TNKILESGVTEGWFREDLYYRLNVVTIHLPPLRERREDIPHLVAYFLSRFSRDLRKEVLGISQEALEALTSYRWPGNIRELENAIKRAMVICKGNEILPEHLPEQIQSVSGIPERIGEDMQNALGPLLDQLFQLIIKAIRENPRLDIISLLEKEMIERAIRLTGGNKVQAASLLGINRNTLRNKMERYGIEDDLARERQ
ncbi:MAG: helix-turn-helix domain-containing protein, partial [bacterium]